MVRYYQLLTQMRVQGCNEYINYVVALLNGTVMEKKTFANYDFRLFDSYQEFCSELYEKEKLYKLCRMVAGFAWKWISKKDKSYKDIEIEGISRMWNCRTENWVYCETAIDEVGCIHSIQGYDLNYAFVILGRDIRYDRESKKIWVDKEQYFDMYGKKSATD